MVEITVQKLSEELTRGGVTMADICIGYPSVKCPSPRVTKRINAFYAHWAKTLMRVVKKKALAAASAEYDAALETSAVFRPLIIAAVFEVTYNDGHTLSLYRDFTVHAGSSARSRTRLGDTWCVSTGWFLSLPSFFPHGERWRRVLIKNAAASAQALIRAGTHSFHGNCAKLIKRRFSPDNFYITEGGVAIFYARGTIAPDFEEIPVFVYKTEIEASPMASSPSAI